jgi:hypothetical protein
MEPDRKLTEEEFVLVAIKATRMRVQEPQKSYFPLGKTNYGHWSTKFHRIARAFRKYFGHDIDETLDRMIKDEKIWAVKTVSAEVGHYRRKTLSVTCLSSFPDPLVENSGNPSLYIAGEVPRRVLSAVSNSAQVRLTQILAFAEVERRPN